MAKRKSLAGDDSDSDGSEEVSLVDIDFEFFSPSPTVDYHALKRLIGQLFQTDAEALQSHELSELILSQAAIGTTIKTDGLESDPYAFLTVLNMNVHRAHRSINAIVKYVLDRSSADPAVNAALKSILDPASGNTVGFIFCERLINMPVQTIPPMYRMLHEELEQAVQNGEPFNFTHLLFISRTYRLSAAEEESMTAPSNAPPSKKKKAPSNNTLTRPSDGIYAFHPEDEYIKKHASHVLDYKFAASLPRDAESFGLDTGGRLMIMAASNLAVFSAEITEAYKP